MPTTPYLNQYLEEGIWQINMTPEIIDAYGIKWLFQYLLHNAIQRPNGYQFDLNASTEPVELFAVYEKESLPQYTTPWSGPYPQDTSITITLDNSAFPNAVIDSTVWEMVGWSVTKNGVTTNYQASQSIDIMVDAPDTTVVANYQQVANTIIINVQSGGNGTVSPSGSFEITVGTPYNLDASFNPTPATNYVFDYWHLSSRGPIASPFTFASTDDGAMLTAYFAPTQPITVTVAAINGTTDKGTGTLTLTVGDTITAIPNSGFKFKRWMLGTSEYSQATTITINSAMANQTLTAEFTSTPTPSLVLPLGLLIFSSVILLSGKNGGR